jgi:hypothetical protein
MHAAFCIFFCLAAALSPMPGQAASPGSAQIVVWAGEPEKPLVCLPLEEGARFYLDFVNSIYLAPVRETFVYEPAEGVFIVMVESPSAGVFEYYGLVPDKPGVAHLRRPVGEIRIRSHDYENHRLTVGDRSVSFKGLVQGGEPLTIKVGRNQISNPKH